MTLGATMHHHDLYGAQSVQLPFLYTDVMRRITYSSPKSTSQLKGKPGFDVPFPMLRHTALQSPEEEIILLYMDERAASSLSESDVDDTASSCAPSSLNEDQIHTPLLPPDVWFTIAMFLSPADVASLALTCSAICGIVQPFAFQALSFRPTISRYHTEASLNELKERLDFLTSEFLAPVVRKMVISGENELHHTAFSHIFSRLDVWPHLTHLSLRGIHLNYPILAAMCIMDTLQCVSLVDCSADEDLNATNMALPVESLHFDTDPSHLAGPPNYLLNPDTLQCLTIGPLCGKVVFASIVNCCPQFTNLTKLNIPASVLYEPVAIPALLQCPKVESISISTADRRSKTSINLPPGVLPRLVEYDGPYDLAQIFSLGRSIRKYTLWPVDSKTIFCESVRIREVLAKLCPTTESLDLGFITQVGFPFLNTVAASFPKLKSLSLNAHPEFCPGFTNLRDFTLLISDSKFPLLGLEELTVGIQLSAGVGGQEALVDLIRSFIIRCRNARAARVVYGHHPDAMWVSWDRPTAKRRVSMIRDSLCTMDRSGYLTLGPAVIRHCDHDHRPRTM